MARSNVSNSVAEAIGTERQFKEQPKAISKIKLIDPKFGGGISQKTDYDAQLLKHSLGILGSAIMNEAEASNKRRDLILTKEADRVWQAATDKDRNELAAEDLMSRYGKFGVNDSGHAVARIENLRGQYLKQQWHNEYVNNVINNQPLAESSQKNAKNYEDYISQKLKEARDNPNSSLKIMNEVAFNEGFNSSNTIDMLKQDEAYQKRVQQELEIVRNNGLSSKADALVQNAINLTPEETSAKLQELLSDSMITLLPPAARHKFVEGIVKGIAGLGDQKILDAIGENVVQFGTFERKDEKGNTVYNDKGDIIYDPKMIKVKDILPFESYKQMSVDKGASLFNKDKQEWEAKLESLPSSTWLDELAKLKASNPKLYQAVAPRFEAAYKAKKNKEQTEAKSLVNAQKKANIDTIEASAAYDIKYQACKNGKTVVDGDWSGDLTFVGSDGKKYTISADLIRQKVHQECFDNYAKYPPEEASAKNMEILTYQINAPYVEHLKKQASRVLSGLNANSFSNGVIDEGLQHHIDMFKANPSAYLTLFGGTENMNDDDTSSVGSQIQSLSNLIGICNGNVQEAVTRFGNARLLKGDPEKRKQVKDAASIRLSYAKSSSVSLPSLAGRKDDTKPISFTFSPGLHQSMMTNMKTYMYCGLEEADAYRQAVEDAKSQFVGYQGSAIAKGFFSSINSTQQQRVGCGYLDMLRDSYANQPGVSVQAKDIHVMYDNRNNTVIITGGGKTFDVINQNNFSRRVDEWLSNMPPQQKLMLEDTNNTALLSSYNNANYYASNPDVATIEETSARLGVSGVRE